LSRLRSLATRALSAFAASSVAAAVFFAALALWPEFAVLRRGGANASVLSSFLLGASLALVFGLAMVSLFYAIVLGHRCRWAAASGYPAWVIIDVGCDTRRDTGSLINGTNEFVFVGGATRNRMLILRRVRGALVVMSALVGLSGVTRWLSVWLSQGGVSSNSDIATLWAGAVLVTYVTFFACGVYEQRVRRRERRNYATSPDSGIAPLHAQLVSMWLAGAEKARRSLGGK
jgi:hypothetical protein